MMPSLEAAVICCFGCVLTVSEPWWFSEAACSDALNIRGLAWHAQAFLARTAHEASFLCFSRDLLGEKVAWAG